MKIALNSLIEEQLCRLQIALTQDTIWRTSTRLLRAAAPCHGVVGIRYYGGRPMLLRTTHPVPDEASYLARLATVGLWWGNAKDPGPRADVRRLSDVRAGRSLSGWRYYEEFLRPNGWRHLAGLLFRAEDGDFLGQLTLHRTAEQGDFSDEELALLKRIHPHIDAAVARLLKLDGQHAGRTALEKVLRTLPMRVVIANWRGEVKFVNRAGVEALHAWTTGPHMARLLTPDARPRLPVEIAQACRRLRLCYEDSVRDGSFRTFNAVERVPHPNLGGQAEVSILPTDFRQAIHPSLLIELQFIELQADGEAQLAERMMRLTPAERAVARHAAEGASNSEIAADMGVSINTVRTHLRNVFDKLGIRSRTKLAQLRGTLQ